MLSIITVAFSLLPWNWNLLSKIQVIHFDLGYRIIFPMLWKLKSSLNKCIKSRKINFLTIESNRTMLCYAVTSVVSNSVRPHRWQPTRLPHPWDSPGKNTGVGCHFLLQWMKVKRESEVAQSCLTLSDPMDCSLPGSSVHGIFQARVLEWGAIAFSDIYIYITAIVPVKCIEFYGRVWAREGILTCEGDLNHCVEGPRKSFHKRGAPT